ncbi:MAG: hypothetical protein E7259_04085 [Lachnospiraceae bacterium]|nr:hypothetical protein [Lachnospiraceae bacterium]
MNDPYNNFFIKAKQTVYKWWCVIYKPVYKLTHNGYWPAEKEPGYTPPAEDSKQKDLAVQMAAQIMATKQDSVNDLVLQAAGGNDEPDFDTSNVDADTLARAEEIMARLNKEAAEDEAKKQAEIDQAKQDAMKAADEQARLAEIMKANQVDISAFIEEGKESQAAEQKKLDQIMKANQVDISAFIAEGKEKQKENNYTIS